MSRPAKGLRHHKLNPLLGGREKHVSADSEVHLLQKVEGFSLFHRSVCVCVCVCVVWCVCVSGVWCMCV